VYLAGFFFADKVLYSPRGAVLILLF